MVGLSLIPIFWMFQFFILVPELRQSFYFDLLAPIIGISAGLYGLHKTRHQKHEGTSSLREDIVSPWVYLMFVGYLIATLFIGYWTSGSQNLRDTSQPVSACPTG
jgi:hypothetical protein